jgi:hypothetical protein
MLFSILREAPANDNLLGGTLVLPALFVRFFDVWRGSVQK